MSEIESFFATRIYRAPLNEFGNPPPRSELEKACISIAEDDDSGQKWCEENGYAGYTSYASLEDLAWRFPTFNALVKVLNKHVAAFVEDLQFDLADKKIELDSLWINILPTGGIHPSHLHPHSVVSGSTYVKMPEGTSSIKFEDPRLAMMMAAPVKKIDVRNELRSFVYLSPKENEVLLWESWLRHEVPLNSTDEERISISFNYRWS